MDLFRRYDLGDTLFLGRLEGPELEVRYSGELHSDMASGSDSLNVGDVVSKIIVR